MPDMLVDLYAMPKHDGYLEELREKGIEIKNVMAPNRPQVFDFVKTNFSEGWAYEAEKGIWKDMPSTFIAVRGKEIIGFASYDCTGLGYFGPLGVLESERKNGVGRALTLRCLDAMREKGFGYAIIGWVGPAKFYEKVAGAEVIESSNKYKRAAIYNNML